MLEAQHQIERQFNLVEVFSLDLVIETILRNMKIPASSSGHRFFYSLST